MEEPEFSDSRDPPFLAGNDKNPPELKDFMAAGELQRGRGCTEDGGGTFGMSDTVLLTGGNGKVDLEPIVTEDASVESDVGPVLLGATDPDFDFVKSSQLELRSVSDRHLRR